MLLSTSLIINILQDICSYRLPPLNDVTHLEGSGGLILDFLRDDLINSDEMINLNGHLSEWSFKELKYFVSPG